MTVEYQMSEKMANALLATRKTEKERGIMPQKWLCDYVNNEIGVRGTCTRVAII